MFLTYRYLLFVSIYFLWSICRFALRLLFYFCFIFQVVKMLVVVVLLFIICWAPILINNVLVGFQHLNPLNYGYLKPMRIVFNLMAYFNSCINPIVYSFMSKNFRETFKHSFRSIFRGRFRNDRKRTGRSTVSFATRSTSLNRSKMYSVKEPDKETSNSSLSENCKVTLVPNTDVSQCWKRFLSKRQPQSKASTTSLRLQVGGFIRWKLFRECNCTWNMNP